MIGRILKGQSLPVYGGGTHVRDWLYVEDHCCGLTLALLRGKFGKTYVMGGKNEMMNRDVIDHLVEIIRELAPWKVTKSAAELITYVQDRPGHDRQTHHYTRNGQSLTRLSLAQLDEIRVQSVAVDWSATICKRASWHDLDPDALVNAREIFISRYRERIPENTIHGWDTRTFRDKAKLTIRGELTRTGLLLLGREQVTGRLNPFIAEMSWKLEGPELAYEHFHPVFLLTSTLLI
jgi:GDP-mannose 4,6 dehydratase